MKKRIEMRFALLLLFLLCISKVTAFSVRTAEVTTITDSILVSKVGAHLLPYFEISKEGSHYNYISGNQKVISELFLNKKKITKPFHEIWILYQFDYPKITGVRAGLWIKLDGHLKLLEEPVLNAVPQFLIDELPCTFIPMQQARTLAMKYFFNPSSEVSDAKLEYAKKMERYIYSVAGKSLTFINGRKIVELEIVELDAYTGKLVNRYDSYNGLIEK